MATGPIVNSITGTDGVVPVYDPSARWCWWSVSEIYTGGAGANRYVPKVRDYVQDTEAHITYVVNSVDPFTLVAELEPISAADASGDDSLVGNGPETFCVYLDTSVVPYSLAVDARLFAYGTMTSYAKIFKGVDLTSTGKVVSFLYDQSGTFLTHNIPLELAAIDSHTNHTIKNVAICYTNERMVDGELVTIVLYSDTGSVVSHRKLRVVNTSFIRAVSSEQKYISHISLKSPFLSENEEHLLEYPLNVPMHAFNMVGVVHYSDNSTLEMPVDNTKFRLYGLDPFISTVPGQELPLVLSYALSPNEAVYGAVSSDGKYITEPYKLVTIEQQGSYSVKLYCYPVWVDAVTGYTLQWFMYNLDRNIVLDVTPHIRFNDNAGVFNGLGYNLSQPVSVRVNLRDVSAAFRSYIHVQTFTVVLKNPGTSRVANWSVGFEPTQDPQYGVGLFARAQMVNQNLYKLKIGAGITNLTDWLTKVYTATRPLLDRRTEARPPTPNYFAIVSGSNRIEFPIELWNSELNINFALAFSGTVFVQFFLRTNEADIQLAVAGLPVYEY